MPIDISKNSILKYFIFGSLYITEGIHIAIAWVLTPLYLLDLGVQPEIVTFSSGLIMIPWIGKFIFGSLSEALFSLGIAIVTGAYVYYDMKLRTAGRKAWFQEEESSLGDLKEIPSSQ